MRDFDTLRIQEQLVEVGGAKFHLLSAGEYIGIYVAAKDIEDGKHTLDEVRDEVAKIAKHFLDMPDDAVLENTDITLADIKASIMGQMR